MRIFGSDELSSREGGLKLFIDLDILHYMRSRERHGCDTRTQNGLEGLQRCLREGGVHRGSTRGGRFV